MPSRHRSRQRALQILYQLELGKQTVGESFQAFYSSLHTAENENSDLVETKSCAPDDFMEQLVRGTFADSTRIDEAIAAHSEHWRLDRMPAVDRNILRLAIHEMTRLDTPAAVVIDEALELARQFSGDASVPFINGVLDAVRKGLEPPPTAS